MSSCGMPGAGRERVSVVDVSPDGLELRHLTLLSFPLCLQERERKWEVVVDTYVCDFPPA